MGGGAPGSTVPLPSKPRSSVFISPLNLVVCALVISLAWLGVRVRVTFRVRVRVGSSAPWS